MNKQELDQIKKEIQNINRNKDKKFDEFQLTDIVDCEDKREEIKEILNLK